MNLLIALVLLLAVGHAGDRPPITIGPIGSGASAPASRPPPWRWPLEPVPRVVRGFEPPRSRYGPGHRGIDLAGSMGQPVLAVATGTVAFVGSVAGRDVVVLDHGAVTSTYQPVSAEVAVGAQVVAGEQIGWLSTVGSHCLPEACLHLGAKRGQTYLDPLLLLPARAVRLEPLGGLPDGQLPDGLLAGRLVGQPPWPRRHHHAGVLGAGVGPGPALGPGPAMDPGAGAVGAHVGIAAGLPRGSPPPRWRRQRLQARGCACR